MLPLLARVDLGAMAIYIFFSLYFLISHKSTIYIYISLSLTRTFFLSSPFFSTRLFPSPSFPSASYTFVLPHYSKMNFSSSPFLFLIFSASLLFLSSSLLSQSHIDFLSHYSLSPTFFLSLSSFYQIYLFSFLAIQ